MDELWKNGYASLSYYQGNDRLRHIMDSLSRGFAGNNFTNIVGYLLYGYGVSDPYMCLADFDSYFATSENMRKTYADSMAWSEKSLVNIAKAGFFAADRSIREYAENIWHMRPLD